MTSLKLPLIAFTLALGALPACNVSLGDETKGELGNVDFSYHESCFFGCGLDQPVLRGSTERIFVTGPGNQADVVVGSTAPEIARFQSSRTCSCDRHDATSAEGYSATPGTTCQEGFTLSCDNYFDVKTGSAGDAKIELKDAAGNLIDRTTVHVRDASEVRFARLPDAGGDAPEVQKIELGIDETIEIVAHPYTKDGKQLLGEHGFVWQTGDPAIAGFDFIIGGPLSKQAPDDARIVHLKAVASGNTQLQVSAGGATSTIEIVAK